jgi:putative ABC transport system permease protein
MDRKDIILEALSALKVNKLATGLALLGMIIGIASVIVIFSYVQSLKDQTTDRFAASGANRLTIEPINPDSNPEFKKRKGKPYEFTLTDVEALKSSSRITTIKYVSPEYDNYNENVVAGKKKISAGISGVIPDYIKVNKLIVSPGRFLTGGEVNAMAKVVVLDPYSVKKLFGKHKNPIGRSIKISGQSFTVIGVAFDPEVEAFKAKYPEDEYSFGQLYVPITTVQKMFSSKTVQSITLEAQNKDAVVQTQNQVGYFFMARRKINDIKLRGFTVKTQKQLLSASNDIEKTFVYILYGAVLIPLVLGGIGIMSVMLITVTHRTREIGLRRAIGAKKSMIIKQFIMESVTLTSLGGIIGIVVGIIALIILSYYVGKASNNLFHLQLSPFSILLAVGVSTSMGVLFGFIPALKASKLDPIDALRYE